MGTYVPLKNSSLRFEMLPFSWAKFCPHISFDSLPFKRLLDVTQIEKKAPGRTAAVTTRPAPGAGGRRNADRQLWHCALKKSTSKAGVEPRKAEDSASLNYSRRVSHLKTTTLLFSRKKGKWDSCSLSCEGD